MPDGHDKGAAATKKASVPGAAAAPAAQDGARARAPLPDGVTPIAGLVPTGPKKVIVEGLVRSVEIRPVERNCVFECTVADDTGSLTAMFYGRTGIPGLGPGTRVRLEGKVSVRSGGPVMTNPAYELVGRPE